MSNLNSICVICGNNVISCICEIIEVPEVDVYVVEESELPCCVSVDKICIFCPHCGDEGSGPCACEFCDDCGMQTSNRRKNGISENGECLCNTCHEEKYHAGIQYPECTRCEHLTDNKFEYGERLCDKCREEHYHAGYQYPDLEVCNDCKKADCYCEQKNEDFHVCMNFGCRNTPEYGKGMCDECWKSLHEKAPEGCITCGVKISTGALCNPCRVKEFTPEEIEGSVSGEDVLCAGCGKEECYCAFIDLVESDWAENVSDCDTVELEDEDFVYAYDAEDVVTVCDSCNQQGCDGPNERGFCLETASNDEYQDMLRRKYFQEQDGPEPVMAAMMILSFFGLVIDIATGKNKTPVLVTGYYLFCAYLIATYGAVIIWFLC